MQNLHPVHDTPVDHYCKWCGKKRQLFVTRSLCRLLKGTPTSGFVLTVRARRNTAFTCTHQPLHASVGLQMGYIHSYFQGCKDMYTSLSLEWTCFSDVTAAVTSCTWLRFLANSPPAKWCHRMMLSQAVDRSEWNVRSIGDSSCVSGWSYLGVKKLFSSKSASGCLAHTCLANLKRQQSPWKQVCNLQELHKQSSW